MSRTHAELFAPLVGRTIKAIVVAPEPPGSWQEEAWGLLLDDDSVAWIDRDPEGNGPGWIAFQPAEPK